MTYVRRAVEGDLPRLLPICRGFHAESPVHSQMPFDDARVGMLILDKLEDPAWLLAVACDDDGAIAGMLMLYAVTNWFGPGVQVGDLCFYVAPEARGGRAALLLMKEALAWAELKGAAKMTLGISTGINEAQAERFFARFGFERTGLLTQRTISPSG